MNKEINSYLLQLLTALGQMDHIDGKVTCSDHEKEKHIPYNRNGLMSMPVGVRRELISKGWDLVSTLTSYEEEIPFPLVVRKVKDFVIEL